MYSMLFYIGLDYASCFFFQAEDGIRDLVRSRGLGDVYKRQGYNLSITDSTNVSSADGEMLLSLTPHRSLSTQGLSLIHI